MDKSSSFKNIRVERIKILMERERILQKDLAYELEMESQNFSRCMRSGKISEEICGKIVKIFPEYRIEWLLGDSNFMLRSDNATIQNLDSVLNKGGIKKLRSGNFVVYDIDYLLENLAREISMLYQAKSNLNKPVLDAGKLRRMFVDYKPCEECTNPDAYGMICVKCGACGRKFDDKGNLIYAQKNY